MNGETREDILIYHAQDRKVVPFLHGPSSERYPEFSPDGRWLVYVLNETGRPEVYLQSFPDGSRKLTVSSQGGDQPCWTSDGRELFYVSLDPPRMMKVSVCLGPDISLGRPQALFDFQFVRCNPVRGYDLQRDGRRFLFTRLKQQPRADITRLTLVLNWTEELKQLVSAK